MLRNSWTDWTETFCGHSWAAGGRYRLKSFFLQKFFFFPWATPGLSASKKIKINILTFKSCFQVFFVLILMVYEHLKSTIFHFDLP